MCELVGPRAALLSREQKREAAKTMPFLAAERIYTWRLNHRSIIAREADPGPIFCPRGHKLAPQRALPSAASE